MVPSWMQEPLVIMRSTNCSNFFEGYQANSFDLQQNRGLHCYQMSQSGHKMGGPIEKGLEHQICA
jgi:hypothetical protein